MSASRTRRQMIQRMGRILRRKQPGVAARFVIMFAKDTLEDPMQRVERDGFLDEIERISDATGVFDGARFAGLDTFLAAPGPEVVPEPEHLERYERAVATVAASPDTARDRVDEALAAAMGVEVAYAFLAFAQSGSNDPRIEPALARLDARLPAPASSSKAVSAAAPAPAPAPGSAPEPPYLELALSNLPEIAKPKVQPKRHSTGQAPLEIARIGSEWRISCTGCGEASRLGPVPVAGPRRDRGLPLRLIRRRPRGSRRRRGSSRRSWPGTSRRGARRRPWRSARRP